MKTFVIINGNKLITKQFSNHENAHTYATNYCDHSLDIIVREIEKQPDTYLLTHSHKHGMDHYHFMSTKDRSIHIHSEIYDDRKEIEDILSLFNIDFEQRYSETIDIEQVTENYPFID